MCLLSHFSHVQLFATLLAAAHPGTSYYGILQARILEWVAMLSSRGSSRPRDWTQVSHIAGRFFTIWATREAHDRPRQYIKKQRHYFANKGPSSQSYGFSRSYVQMWELNQKESWVPKNWCFQTVVLKKTLESPLDSKEIKPINPKGNKPWIFIGRTDAEAEAAILWPSDAKNWLTGKDHDAGKYWRQEEKGWQRMQQMDGWHHQLSGHESEQTLGDSEGQGSLVCCSSWGHKESVST